MRNAQGVCFHKEASNSFLPPKNCIAGFALVTFDMSRIELAVEKVKHLDENQAEALLEWLALRENRDALRQRLDQEIQIGLDQLSRGEKIPGEQVHAEIQQRSRSRRAGKNG